MERYTTEQIRNVALTGHSGSGKTMLVEALLHTAGLIDRVGSIENGNTVSDYDAEEQKRQVSINATLAPLALKDVKINLLDCPGFRDFVGEIKNAIRVAEMAMIVVDATTGVEVGTEFAVSFADEYRIPKAFFVNKMEKERANFDNAIASIEASFPNVHCIPVTLPIGIEGDFKGVIDLLTMKAIYDEGGKREVKDIPAELAEAAEEAHRRLVEAAAEGDDALTEKFLIEETLSDEEIKRGLREDLEEGRFAPVLCGSAAREIGLTVLQHFFVHECPPPNERKGFLAYKDESKTDKELKQIDPSAPFSAMVFKTVNDEFVGRLSFFKCITGEAKGDGPIKNARTDQTERVGHVFTMRGKQQVSASGICAGDIGTFSKLETVRTGDTLLEVKGIDVVYAPTKLPKPTAHMAVEAKSKSDEDRLGMGIHKMLETDPTLSVMRDSLLHQTVISGMGDTHLDVVVARLEHINKIQVVMSAPRVQYRETISKAADGQGRYKKQTGGRGQFGDCWVRMRPVERGTGFEFVWKVVGGSIPTNFQSSIEKGLRESLNRGIIAGYPVVDVHAECYDGSFHAVDSSDMAFQVAASLAFKNVAPKCGPQLLEPINKVVVEVPDTYMGDIMGYVSGKRGRIAGTDQLGARVRINAEVPAAEMATFSRDLRSMTQGRAIFESEFDHYDPVPPGIVDKVIEEVRIDHHEAD